MRIGVDVGGTNTDAALMDGRKVLATRKTPTTENIADGVVGAVAAVLGESGIEPASLQALMIGTTHFTNAFLERRGLLPVAILRIALPSSRGVPPLIDWPEDLRRAMGAAHYLIRGGYRFDGRPADALDERAVREAARDIRAKGLTSAAVTGLFSPVNPEMELRAEQILRAEAPEVRVTLSSKIGRMGLLERENAAVMNASLADLSRTVALSFRAAFRKLDIRAPFFISQNDGTLMSADFAERHPVLTFASGPTNSMRGAAYLSNLKNALVADIGGTTTDIGALLNGFPRESALAAGIGGVRTNFRMPDVLCLGLGGGSLASLDNGAPRIGPRSLGYRLTEQALVFGGQTLTATDLAVAAGYADLGDRSLVRHLPARTIDRGIAAIHRIIAEGVDRMKTGAAPVPLVLVGGGVILVRDAIPGTSQVALPEHAAVANAVGASIAQISGETDRVFAYDAEGREAALATAEREARERALEAGADSASLEVVEREELPLDYMPGSAVRIRVKVAGNPRGMGGLAEGGP